MSATELGIFWLSGFRAVEVPVWANHPIVLSLFPIFYLGDVCRIASVVSHQSHPQKEYPDAFKHHAKTCPVYTQHLTLKKKEKARLLAFKVKVLWFMIQLIFGKGGWWFHINHIFSSLLLKWRIFEGTSKKKVNICEQFSESWFVVQH